MNAYALSLLTPSAPLVQRSFAHPTNATTWEQMSNPAEVFIAVNDDRPKMMWAHFVLPHPPVRLDRSCGPQRDSWRNGQALTFGASDDQLRRDAYVEQVECVNAEMVEQLEPILNTLPETDVPLFSDHGPDGSGQLVLSPGELSADQIKECLGILLAVRVRRSCPQIHMVETLLSSARAFVACTLGLDFHPIAERSFLVPAQETDVPVVETELANRP
jgi:hypothetical protein